MVYLNCHLPIPYKQIFFETLKFIIDNNNSSKPYLEYPKLYLNSKPPQCNEKQHCKQCHGHNANRYSNSSCVFFLCSRLRRRIGNELFDCGQKQECATQSLRKTATKLYLSDRLLIAHSNEYILCDNWFSKVYSFLTWQQGAIEELMYNAVYLDEHDSNIFLSKLELFTLIHAYFDQLIEYLLLYYCCFNTQSWISVFYPFIEYGIGTKQCNMLFAAPTTSSTTKAPSVYDETLKFNQINDISQEKITREIRAVY